MLRAPWCDEQYNKSRGMLDNFNLRLAIAGGGINPDFGIVDL